MTARQFRRLAIAAGVALLALAGRASAMLDTAGFRAVGVAHSAFPVSSMALAPDGRLFVAVQTKGQTTGTTPGTAEIRVYATYKDNDGSVFDEGVTWATVDGVRSTNLEEGLLGIAIAPDFAATKLVYVYLTTTEENVNQHIRVYRETPDGIGQLVGTIQQTLEPPSDQTTRNGGGLVFGPDNCLHAGIGDNGANSRWNSQLLVGTDNFQSNEANAYCTDVCRDTTEYPQRTINDNGELNYAGKVLRFAVDGTTATPAPGALLPDSPTVFAAGLRNPTSFGVHPLTGQLYATESRDGLEAELDIVDNGSNQGWPCLEGSGINTAAAACLGGQTAASVYANHPGWRRPVATHASTQGLVATGVAAYTGLAYPEEFYGDVFYLLRDSARIYRIDLQPPCFLPHPGGVTPVKLHDSNTDGDFTVFGEFDADPQLDQISATTLMAMVQGPDPQGRQVLYVAGKQGNAGFTDDSFIFRIEFAAPLVPYGGPTTRVADACFTDGVYSGGTGPAPYAYENPFQRGACVVAGGVCSDKPDGTPCDDGQVCNGAETCQGGVCRAGTAAADGTACLPNNRCLSAGTCQHGGCVAGPALADGTPCPDADACNGLETCVSGSCQAGTGPQPLTVRGMTLKKEKRPGSGAVALTGSIRPVLPIDPQHRDGVMLEVAGASSSVGHPASDRRWKRSKAPRVFLYQGGGRGLTAVRLKQDSAGGYDLLVRGKGLDFQGEDAASLSTRLVIGDQCFAAAPGCSADRRRVRCQ